MERGFSPRWRVRLEHVPDAGRALLALAAVVLLVLGADGGWFLVAAFVAALLPRVADLARPFDLAFVVAMALNGAGNAFGLFATVGIFDEAAHLLTTLLGAPVAYAALARVADLPRPSGTPGRSRALGLLSVTAALGLAPGAVWELVEWGLDAWVGTDLSLGYTDTLVDLTMDTAGALLAGAAVVLWARHGWTGIRRLDTGSMGAGGRREQGPARAFP